MADTFLRKKIEPYTLVYNRIILDTSLSGVARFFLIYLLSKPDNWKVYKEFAAQEAGITVYEVRKCATELKKAGYYQKIPVYQGNRIVRWMDIITDTPFNPDELLSCIRIDENGNEICHYKPIPSADADPAAATVPESEPTADKPEVICDPPKEEKETAESYAHIYTEEEAREIVSENIAYEIKKDSWSADVKEYIDNIFDVMVDVISSTKYKIKVSGELRPASEVKKRFFQIDDSHIEYVCGCLDMTSTDIKNIKAYLLTALYNAPQTMEIYYSQQVRHDQSKKRTSSLDEFFERK
jgi:hypothetical protein